MGIRAAIKDIFEEMGSCMGCGGFVVDADGHLVEEYTDDEEETSEGMSGDGDESQNREDFCGIDCVRSAAERGGA